MSKTGSLEQRDVKALQLALANREVDALVDVRGQGEYDGGHVPGARNIPLGDIPQSGPLLNKGETIWLICRSGSRSAKAASALTGLGFDVINVAGGTTAWRRAGYPVEPEGAEKASLLAPIVLSLALGLAPFSPEPHLFGKLRWIAGGAVGMGAADWFDLAMHGTPWIWLAWALLSRLKR